MRVAVIAALAVAAAAVLWVLNCSGPQAQVESVRLQEPSGPGEPYQIEATVHNTGPGEGQVVLTFRLHDQATGEIYQTEGTAQIKSDETLNVSAEIRAPRGDYRPEVKVEYPVR